LIHESTLPITPRNAHAVTTLFPSPQKFYSEPLMNLLDSKGRLFGKFSLLDIGAALVILLTIIGIFVVGAVVGGQKVKIGTLIELEGDNYNFNTSVIDVRLPKRS